MMVGLAGDVEAKMLPPNVLVGIARVVTWEATPDRAAAADTTPVLDIAPAATLAPDNWAGTITLVAGTTLTAEVPGTDAALTTMV